MRHIGILLALLPGSALAQSLPMDTPVTIGGIETVCTGVGLDARADPRWQAYGLKIEVAGPGGDYLAGEHVTIRKDATELLAASCDAPWMLLRLPPGRYGVDARIGDQTVSSPALVPAGGQGRIVLRFAAP